MKKSMSELAYRFKLESMVNLERTEEDASAKKSRAAGRSSLSSIPPPDPAIIFNQKAAAKVKKEPPPPEPETPPKVKSLCDILCSAPKLVVNYGVFEPNFEWMPFELLVLIFDYLNTRDLLTAGMVCRHWLEATQYFRLTRKILLHFQVFKYSDNAYPMNRFLDTSRFYPNVKFSIVKFQPGNDSFFLEFGDVVEELTFNSCMINKPEFLHIINLCPRLHKLSITRCEDLYRSWMIVKKLSLVRMKFPFMSELTIIETSQINKSIFEFMVAAAPNLSSLTLANCFGFSQPRERVQVLDSLIEFVTSQAPKMKVLNIANTQIDELFLLKLADIENLLLEELHFTFNGVVTTIGRSGILSLLRNQPKLEILDLTDSKGVSNYCLTEICRFMPLLKKLTLSKCWQINDGGLREINRLTNLKILDVSSCDRITDRGLLEGLVAQGKKCLEMKELRLGLLPYMSIVAVYRLSQHYNDLEVLDLSGSSNAITDEALHMIFRNQCKLKYLNLDCCAKITDFGLDGLPEQTGTGNFLLFVPYTINRLTELRYLNLGGCYQLTDKCFINALNLPELKEINLSRCHNITETGLKLLFKRSPLLDIIDLSECYNVKDSTVQLLSEDLRRLETLKLNGCTQITEEIFDSISRNCKYLKNLFIRRCPRILGNPFEVLRDVRYIYNQ